MAAPSAGDRGRSWMRLDGIDLLRGLAISFVLGGRSPSFFLAAIVMAGLLGDVVANVYSQPMNRLLRVRTGENRFGSAVEAAGNPTADNHLTA